MHATRRELFKSSFATAAAAVLPNTPTKHHIPTTTEFADTCAKLDAVAALPVFKRELFPNPVIIDSIELLHYKKSWLCRVRSKDGAEGISISNAQQMASLWPIFMDRIAPFFLEQDARDLERLLELSMVYQSNYKATGLAVFVPLATLEFAILDMFGKMSKHPIGLLISDKIYNPKIAVYQANGERYISAEETIAHLQRDVAISKAKAIKFKLGGRMSFRWSAKPSATRWSSPPTPMAPTHPPKPSPSANSCRSTSTPSTKSPFPSTTTTDSGKWPTHSPSPSLSVSRSPPLSTSATSSPTTP